MRLKRQKRNFDGKEYLEEVKFQVMKSMSENAGFNNRPF